VWNWKYPKTFNWAFYTKWVIFDEWKIEESESNQSYYSFCTMMLDAKQGSLIKGYFKNCVWKMLQCLFFLLLFLPVKLKHLPFYHKQLSEVLMRCYGQQRVILNLFRVPLCCGSHSNRYCSSVNRSGSGTIDFKRKNFTYRTVKRKTMHNTALTRLNEIRTRCFQSPSYDTILFINMSTLNEQKTLFGKHHKFHQKLLHNCSGNKGINTDYTDLTPDWVLCNQ